MSVGAKSILAISVVVSGQVFGLGFPEHFDSAVALIEKRCADLPSVGCWNTIKNPDGSDGSLVSALKECQPYCTTEASSCPLSYLPFCPTPDDFFPIATGFLLQLCGFDPVLVSNRHVLVSEEAISDVYVRARLSNGDAVRLPLKLLRGHANPHVDLAVGLPAFPAGGLPAGQKVTIGHIPEDETRRDKGSSWFRPISHLRAGDSAAFAGFPLAIGGVRALLADRETPLIRAGIISLVLPGTTKIGSYTFHDVFLMDSWAFQGNSGSPVLIPPVMNAYVGDDRERDRAFLVGVVSAFIDFDAPIERAVVLGGVRAKINSGLAVVQSLDGLEDVVATLPGARCVPLPTLTATRTPPPTPTRPITAAP
jgi:hypothetical protein